MLCRSKDRFWPLCSPFDIAGCAVERDRYHAVTCLLKSRIRGEEGCHTTINVVLFKWLSEKKVSSAPRGWGSRKIVDGELSCKQEKKRPSIIFVVGGGVRRIMDESLNKC